MSGQDQGASTMLDECRQHIENRRFNREMRRKKRTEALLVALILVAAAVVSALTHWRLI